MVQYVRLQTFGVYNKLAQIYNALARNGFFMMTRMSVQQQINHIDCGVFSIAYAYHAALGNDLSCLNFH